MGNLDEILAHFQNGDFRYGDSRDFKEACDSLNAGIGVYAVLDHTLRELAKTRDVIKWHEATINMVRESRKEFASPPQNFEI